MDSCGYNEELCYIWMSLCHDTMSADGFTVKLKSPPETPNSQLHSELGLPHFTRAVSHSPILFLCWRADRHHE